MKLHDGSKNTYNANTIRRPGHSLGVGRVDHAKNELNDCTVELQTSAEQILIQKAHIRTRFCSHKFLKQQKSHDNDKDHMLMISSKMN